MIKFGTDGWRAIMAEDFTFSGVRQVAGAIADYVRAHQAESRGVVVGYDTRFLSERFADAAAEILMGRGIRVLKTDRDTPTPVVAFAVQDSGAFGAVMITASHNPPEYNGIKFIPEYAGPASPEITAEIEEFLAAGSAPTPAGHARQAESLDPREPYRKHLEGLLNINAIVQSGLHVVFDPMYATGRGYLENLFPPGFIEVLHGHPDPMFGGAMPEPKEEYLTELRERVVATGGIGLATDGDADRFGIIDSNGTYITPNQLIALLLYYLVKWRGLGGSVARTVATTHLIDRIAGHFGIPVSETPVGFKYIGERMRKDTVIIGGEESGGLSILGHIPEKDGILACALAAEMRAVTARPLSDTLQEIVGLVGPVYSRRVDLHLNPQSKERLIQRLKSSPPERVGGLPVEKVLNLDGIKLLLSRHNWVLARPSGTEPLVRIYFESDTPQQLETMISEFESLAGQA